MPENDPVYGSINLLTLCYSMALVFPTHKSVSPSAFSTFYGRWTKTNTHSHFTFTCNSNRGRRCHHCSVHSTIAISCFHSIFTLSLFLFRTPCTLAHVRSHSIIENAAPPCNYIFVLSLVTLCFQLCTSPLTISPSFKWRFLYLSIYLVEHT